MKPSVFSRAFLAWAALAAGAGMQVQAQTLATGLRFTPVTPCRIMDSRGNGFIGAFGLPALAAGATRTLPVAGTCNIPLSAKAFALNVTLVPINGQGVNSVTVWPSGQTRPNTNTVVEPKGRIAATNAIVAAGGNGAVDLYATQATHLVIDINGYFSPSGALEYYPMTPCRVIETRANAAPPDIGAAFGPPALAAGVARSFPLPQGRCGIPANAEAYYLNLTVVPPGPLGYLTVFPTGQAQPFVSTLNAQDGRVLANGVIAPAGSNGAISVYAIDPTELIVDIAGYFAAPNGSTSQVLNTVQPCRASSLNFFPTGAELTTGVTGTCSVPSNATGVAMNLTASMNQPVGFFSVWPTGQAWPGVSIMNATTETTGSAVGNGAIVTTGTNGQIQVQATAAATATVDVTGYFTPGGPIQYVSQAVSPAVNDVTSLIVDWRKTQTVGPLTLIIHNTAGQIQGSCYATVNEDTPGQYMLRLYDTQTSTPTDPYVGQIGSNSGWPGGWFSPPHSGCSANSGSSSVEVLNSQMVRLKLTLQNGTQPYTKQVVAVYTLPCTGWQCQWTPTTFQTTIGQWDATPPAPMISNVSAATTSYGATFTWTTSELATSEVRCGASAGNWTLPSPFYQDPVLATQHTYTIAEGQMQPSSGYACVVMSVSANRSASASIQITTKPALTSSTLTVTPGVRGATFGWTTSANTNNGQVRCTASNGAVSTFYETPPVNSVSHMVTAPEGTLAPGSYTCTGYATTASSGSSATTATGFTTRLGIEPNITAQGNTSTAATFTWNTTLASTTAVSCVSTQGGATIGPVSNGTLVTLHSIQLTGLTVGVTYQCTVTSTKTSPNETVTGTVNYSQNLVIGSPVVSQITGTGATISWTTNGQVQTRLKYRKTSESTWTSSANTPAGTSHLIALTGLASGQTYVFYVEDLSGTNRTADSSFTTTGGGSTTSRREYIRLGGRVIAIETQ